MNIRNFVISLLTATLVAMPTVALAQIPDPGAISIVDAPLEVAILNIVNFFLILLVIVAVVILILGGVRYIISQGDEDATTKAKNTILYAVIGLLVIGLSLAIVRFVLRAVAAGD